MDVLNELHFDLPSGDALKVESPFMRLDAAGQSVFLLARSSGRGEPTKGDYQLIRPRTKAIAGAMPVTVVQPGGTADLSNLKRGFRVVILLNGSTIVPPKLNRGELIIYCNSADSLPEIRGRGRIVELPAIDFRPCRSLDFTLKSFRPN